MQLINYFKLFINLLWRDIRQVKTNFHDYVIDALCWTVTNVLIATYILPLLGISGNYGSFMIGGTMISMCLFHSVNKSNVLVDDFTGIKSISYDLTLPLPSVLVFIKIAIAIAIESALINILSLPMCKILLGSNFDLSNFNILPWTLTFIVINIFFGFFALWIASWVKQGRSYPHVWMRFVLPIWSFGGYQFPWKTLKASYPGLGYLNLANPMVYAFEGIRNATLGAKAYLSLPICLVMLIGFTIFFALHGMYNLKRRLDFV